MYFFGVCQDYIFSNHGEFMTYACGAYMQGTYQMNTVGAKRSAVEHLRDLVHGFHNYTNIIGGTLGKIFNY
jgi:hypothetical protein